MQFSEPRARRSLLVLAAGAAALWLAFALLILLGVEYFRPSLVLAAAVLAILAFGTFLILGLAYLYDAQSRFDDQLRSDLTEALSENGAALSAELTELTKAIESSIAQASSSARSATSKEGLQTRRQLEGTLSLYGTLDLTVPLEPMQDWAINGDTAAYLVRLIATKRPRHIVELGSGVSTVIIAAALRKLGIQARFYAFEHDLDYRLQTEAALRREGLLDRATIVHAPLVELTIGEARHRWYQPSAFSELDEIDLLLVDGPPGDTGPRARYPAFPLLSSKLSATATVMLDDANRGDEQAILNKWREEGPDFDWTMPWTGGKGLAVGFRNAVEGDARKARTESPGKAVAGLRVHKAPQT